MTARVALVVVVVALLAACGRPTSDPGENVDDPNATAERTVPSASDDQGQQLRGVATGVVVDAAGRPVPGALVQPTSLDVPTRPIPELAVVTDAQGRYTWRLPAGRYELAARVGDRMSAPVRVVVTADGAARADLTVA